MKLGHFSVSGRNGVEMRSAVRSVPIYIALTMSSTTFRAQHKTLIAIYPLNLSAQEMELENNFLGRNKRGCSEVKGSLQPPWSAE